ncbi:MAG: hypothetical protein OXE58_06900 [Acidobacteria bacterium]|nr:hypothetical protein [Acidobacteriota bacterium]
MTVPHLGVHAKLELMDANPRQALQRLVARLPEPIVPAALRAVTELAIQRDPFLANVLAAPEENEELTDWARRAVQEGDADIDAGRVHSTEEIKREFGL